jgi:two-component system sensor histidine kinase KdpD
VSRPRLAEAVRVVRSAAARTQPVPVGFVLPVAAAALLVLGAVSAQTHGDATAVLPPAAVVVALGAVVGGDAAAVIGAFLGWLTVSGFSRAPYADLQPRGLTAVWVLTVAAAGGWALGAVGRLAYDRQRRGATLEDMRRLGHTGASLGRGRQLLGLALAASALPLVTVALVLVRPHLSLADELLVFLLVVVSVTIVGGFWSAVVAAVAAGLLVNWFFVLPRHTLAVDTSQNLFALLLFVAVAVVVSSVVHLAARRTAQAHASGRETDALLALAQTVFAGADTPTQVLEHLRGSLGLPADLAERNGTRWSAVAAVGDLDLTDVSTVQVREDLLLRVSGAVPEQERLLAAFAAQAAAALDRDRLRAQASQAEALAAGNRMRNALLAAVSHDLRTPLASVKAAVSSLRQDDVSWSAADEAELLATIEESADRLDALIGNLLDMSRLQAGALQPYLQDTSLEEIAPLALAGLDGAAEVALDLPADLPLVRTDPGLLERVISNLLSNAITHSPPGRPPALVAARAGDAVIVTVADHGPGVPVGSREVIFEPFQRLGDSGRGVGLGLAVAKGFCDAMGIPIDVGETPGGGLTMTLSLRIAPSHAPAAVR